MWAAVGAILSFSLIGAASIGLFLLPAAVGGLALARAFVRVCPRSSVLSTGLPPRFWSWGSPTCSTPCPSSGRGFSLGETAGTTSSCGGLDSTPWLVVGVVLAVAGLMSYALARRRS